MTVRKFAIADDHEIFRQGLKLVLSDDPSLKFVCEAENGFALIQLIRQHQPDVVLLDLKMPGMDGFAATKEIRSEFPEMKILVLTMFHEEQFIISLLEAGANGYLTKNYSPEKIKQAIHTVCDEGFYHNEMVSRALLKKLVQHNLGVPSFKPGITLSEKEVQVLQLICQELTAAEIGEKIFLSARTIDGIRAGLMEKLGVRNIAGLVMYAVKNGLA
jgi:DNA-binding NarL/FixJ family response regulator